MYAMDCVALVAPWEQTVAECHLVEEASAAFQAITAAAVHAAAMAAVVQW
jgi:hypothetical protein